MKPILTSGGAVVLRRPTPKVAWSIGSGSGLLLVTLLVATLAGCSSDPGSDQKPNTKENGSENNVTIDCQRGVAAPDGQTCVNATNCESDTKKCLDGFACYQDVCRQVECGEGLPACARGTCNDEGICVSKSTCQAGDTDTSCVDGEVCINRACEPVQKCESLPRCGAVDPACELRRASCIETTTCASSDSCRSMNFCNPTNQKCERNHCILPGGEKDCAADGGGICNKSTGVCESVEVCTKAAECRDSADLNEKKVCTLDPSDTSATDKKCLTFRDVCDATCRTQANCAYDDTNLTMTCGDGTCSVMDDCKKSEYCNSGTCEAISSYQCVADAYEGVAGNNDKADATNFEAVQKGGVIKDLTLCKDDVDVFVIDDLAPYMGANDLFAVDLKFDEGSKGRKIDAQVTVELVELDSATPPTETPKETLTLNTYRAEPASSPKEYKEGVVFFPKLSSMLDSTKKNKAYITVKHNNPAADLGVTYSLSVQRSDEGIFEMCRAQTPLVFSDSGLGYSIASLNDQNLNSAPTESASFIDQSACTDANREVKELAYSFTVEEGAPKKVELAVTPKFSSGLDVVVALLKDCTGGVIDTNPLDDSGCRQATGTDQAESYATLLEPGDYTVVVTARSRVDVGTGMFDIVVKQYPEKCDPAASNKCSAPNEKEVCDPFRQELLIPELCPSGEACFDYGKGVVGCTADFGSVCEAPHVFSETAPISDMLFDTKSMKGQQKGNSQFTCDGGLEQGQVTGGEVFLRGIVGPGKTAIVRAKSDPLAPVARTIYAKASCDAVICDGATYFDGDKTAPALYSYTNNGSVEEEVIFVVETGDKGGNITVDAYVVDASTLACQPGKTSCDKADPLKEKMQICLDDGTGSFIEETKACVRGLGCDDTGLPPACVRGGDTCEKAYPILPEVVYNITLGEYTDVLGRVNSCDRQPSGLGYNTGSNDFIFKVDADIGDTIKVNVVGTSDVVLWQIDGDCSTLNATAPQCKYFSDTGDNNEMIEVVSDGNPAYFVVERYSDNIATLSDKVNIYAEVMRPNCSATITKPTCDLATGTITFCDAEDKLHKKVCPDGCLEGPARCDTTREPDLGAGLSCGSPKMLEHSATAQTIEGELGGGYYSNSIQLPLGLVGECSLEATGTYTTTRGNDAIYGIALAEGEVLEYRLGSGSTSLSNNEKYRVYVVGETCSANTCRNMRDGAFVGFGGVPLQPNRVDWFKYHSRATGTDKDVVYLVVDSVDPLDSGIKFTLEYKVTNSSTPGVTEERYWSHCEGNSVVFTKADGSMANASCPNGTVCENGACKPNNKATGDKCDATILKHNGPGFYVLETSNVSGTVEYTNDVSPTCGAANIDSTGSDYFFEIEIPAGEVLSVVGMSGSRTKPVVYIAEDCTKLKSGAPDACLAAAQGGGTRYNLDDFAIADYVNTSGAAKTVVVGLDSGATGAEPANSREPIYYMVDILPAPTCATPGEVTCAIDTSNQARLYKCIGGQTVAVPGGACTINNSCTADGTACFVPGEDPANAEKLNRETVTTTTSVNTQLHDRNDTSSRLVKTNSSSDSMVYGSCTFMKEPIGPDYYYEIELNKGDYLTATLKSAGSGPLAGDIELMTFYLLDGDGKTCVTFAQLGSTNRKFKNEHLTINFQALKGGKYYLVVDSFDASVLPGYADFEIEYVVDAKGVDNCVKYMTECKDNNTLYVCDADGGAANEVTCPYGCIGLACRAGSATGSFDNCTSTAPAFDSSVAILYDDDDTSMQKDFVFSSTNQCAGVKRNSEGKTDIFMKFNLQPNQFLNVFDRRSYYSLTPAYYIMPETACGPPASYSCLAIAQTDGSHTEVGTAVRNSDLSSYIASAAETVRLGITTTLAAYSRDTLKHAAVAFVEVSTATCTPTAYSCSATSTPAKVTYCESLTTAATFTCPTNNCNGNICEAGGAKPGNTPYEAIELQTAANWTTDNSTGVKTGVYNGSTQGLDHSYGSDTGKPTGCDNSAVLSGLGLRETFGRDAFHKVRLSPGDRLLVKADRTSALGPIHAYLLKLGDKNLAPTKKTLPMPTCYGNGYSYATTALFTYEYPATASGPADFLVVVGGIKKISHTDYLDYTLTTEITPP